VSIESLRLAWLDERADEISVRGASMLPRLNNVVREIMRSGIRSR